MNPEMHERPHVVQAEPSIAHPRPGWLGSHRAVGSQGGGASFGQHLEHHSIFLKYRAVLMASSG